MELIRIAGQNVWLLVVLVAMSASTSYLQNLPKALSIIAGATLLGYVLHRIWARYERACREEAGILDR